MDNSTRKPNKIWLNTVRELCNRSFKKWLEDNVIEMHSTQSQAKSFVVEKFIKTLKNKNYKHMAAVSRKFHIDKLDDTVNEHNNTYHRKIKIKHIELKDNIYRGSKKAPYFVFISKSRLPVFFRWCRQQA